ncbi:MAG TPA: AbrB/MazE/SpoVT family DNA-binding domain-containing protein [Terriglobia bacterium]|nr:AbrB/MazE/SpoVT family DNA-binding domain-containing protein [Terriglobia bacterium]
MRQFFRLGSLVKGHFCPTLQNGKMSGLKVIMKTKVTLDRAGRVVLPKSLRDERLSPGDTLDITVQGEEVALRPRRSSSPLQKKQGVWVFSTEASP